MATSARAAASASFEPPSVALCSFGLALASFMQVLDGAIANVSLPTIAGNLGASSHQGTWVITAFAVSTAIALPLTGWLSRRCGEVRLFVWSTLAFTLASLFCGLAHSMFALVLARALQGLVCGPMYPLTQSLILKIYPDARRGQALALLSVVTVVAPVVGPVVGGWITDRYNWPWIFLINVPLGVIAAVLVGYQMKGYRQKIEHLRIDYVGLVTLVLWVGALQILLDLGNDEDWFNSRLIIVLSCIVALALAVFLIWELTDPEPVVDLHLFRHRNFAIGTGVMVLAFAGFFYIGILVPQWLQRDLSYNAFSAGLATAPIGFLPVLIMPFLGRYARHFDMRMLATIAFIDFTVTSFMRAGFDLDIDFRHVAVVQFAQGVGVALFFMPMLQILLSDLERSEIASGSGLFTFLRTLGASFATSFFNYLWTQRTEVHHADLAEHVSDYLPGVHAQVLALGHGDLQRGAALVNDMIDHQASQMGFNDIFYLLGSMFLLIIGLVWLTRSSSGLGGVSRH